LLKINLFSKKIIIPVEPNAVQSVCVQPKIKNMFKKYTMAFFAVFALALVSCSKDEDDNTPPPAPTPNAKGSVTLMFDHKWGPGNTDFQMNTDLTHPGTGATLNFNTLNYYISNISLRRVDGSWWTEEESYHLVTVSSEETKPTFKLEDIPVGEYDAIRYTIGVDSTRNVSGAQVGALDPANGMFWSWNTGYIFVKAEGNFTNDGNSGSFTYHLGGFRHSNNTYNLHTKTETFNGGVLQVSEGGGHGGHGHHHGAKIHFFVNAARFWHGGVNVSEVSTVHMPGANAILLGGNFAGGVRVDHIH
jgi:hypothetical protein